MKKFFLFVMVFVVVVIMTFVDPVSAGFLPNKCSVSYTFDWGVRVLDSKENAKIVSFDGSTFQAIFDRKQMKWVLSPADFRRVRANLSFVVSMLNENVNALLGRDILIFESGVLENGGFTCRNGKALVSVPLNATSGNYEAVALSKQEVLLVTYAVPDSEIVFKFDTWDLGTALRMGYIKDKRSYRETQTEYSADAGLSPYEELLVKTDVVAYYKGPATSYDLIQQEVWKFMVFYPHMNIRYGQEGDKNFGLIVEEQ